MWFLKDFVFISIFWILDVYIDNEKNSKKYNSLTKSCSIEYSKDNQDAFEILESSLNKYKFSWTQLYLESNLDNNLNEQVLNIFISIVYFKMPRK